VKVKFAFFTYKGYKATVANKRDKSTKQQLAEGIRVAAAEESDAAAASVSSDGSIPPLLEDPCHGGFSGSISPLSENPCHGGFSGSISQLSEEEDSCNDGFSGDKEADITTQSRFKLAFGELTYFRPKLLSVVIQSNTLEQSVSTRANTCSKCAQFSDSVQDPNGLIDSAGAAQCSHKAPLEKLHGCSIALKPFTNDTAFPMHKIIKQDEGGKKNLDADGQYRTDPRSRFVIEIRIALPPQTALL
jgi:hypothetical protein